MHEWTDEQVLEKGERIRAILEDKMDCLYTLGTFHVFLQLYGKDDMGIRLSIVKLSASSKSEGQILTVVYEAKALQTRTVQNLASGPFGQAKRIMKEMEDERIKATVR